MINKHYDMKQGHTFYISFLVYSVIYDVKVKQKLFLKLFAINIYFHLFFRLFDSLPLTKPTLLAFLLVRLKSSLRKFYGRHHDLVNRYVVSVSQMTTDMFHLF